ncbi:MAG: peptidoglycan-binding domain-containing protein, partial [Gammaproteobacteria bacterium]|nr:peptidoglycan-binding domain-containing protein [Gammaproteobacteria bacterium]
MRLRFVCLLLSGLLLYPAQLRATDDTGKFAMKGAGFLPCKVFVLEREKRSNIYYMIGGWLEGYLSAHNKYSKETFDVASFESLELLLRILENHCKSNPEDRLYSVISSMVNKLAETRLKFSSQRVKIVEGERKTALYRETIRRIQQALKRRGLYKGEIDGKFTERTKSAIIAFQSDLEFEM